MANQEQVGCCVQNGCYFFPCLGNCFHNNPHHPCSILSAHPNSVSFSSSIIAMLLSFGWRCFQLEQRPRVSASSLCSQDHSLLFAYLRYFLSVAAWSIERHRVAKPGPYVRLTKYATKGKLPFLRLFHPSYPCPFKAPAQVNVVFQRPCLHHISAMAGMPQAPILTTGLVFTVRGVGPWHQTCIWAAVLDLAGGQYMHGVSLRLFLGWETRFQLSIIGKMY